ncbi:MAG: hypothetical protein AB8I08_17930 [Sandaracinaceae bacterium]
MRLGRFVMVIPFLLLFACAEAPECLAPPSGEGAVLDCSAGKVPVCGDDPMSLYDEGTGALLPVPGDEVANGSCDGVTGPCRTRPVCGSVGGEATCADGTAPRCVLGRVVEIRPEPMPTPDAGPPPVDAGSDAGTDAGTETDAGTDAGTEVDAGTDGGPIDSGVDAG